MKKSSIAKNGIFLESDLSVSERFKAKDGDSLFVIDIKEGKETKDTKIFKGKDLKDMGKTIPTIFKGSGMKVCVRHVEGGKKIFISDFAEAIKFSQANENASVFTNTEFVDFGSNLSLGEKTENVTSKDLEKEGEMIFAKTANDAKIMLEFNEAKDITEKYQVVSFALEKIGANLSQDDISKFKFKESDGKKDPTLFVKGEDRNGEENGIFKINLPLSMERFEDGKTGAAVFSSNENQNFTLNDSFVYGESFVKLGETKNPTESVFAFSIKDGIQLASQNKSTEVICVMGDIESIDPSIAKSSNVKALADSFDTKEILSQKGIDCLEKDTKTLSEQKSGGMER